MNSILIVEDEALIALSLQMKLEKLGYNVPAVVHTGEDAIAEATKCNPDLILMDINLAGEINGITAAEQIHTIQKTPIVFLTAYSDEATLQKAKGADPYAYLIKPFKERELRSTIEVALYKHQKETQEFNKIKAQAEESNRLKRSFLATMDHEVRTPMNAILGFMEMLKRPGYSTEKRDTFLKSIEVSSQRLVVLIDNILNISKVDSGSMDVSMAEINLNELLKICFENSKGEAEKKGLQYIFEEAKPGSLATIKTDRNIIESVLALLLNNAIKFTPTGTVTLGAHIIMDNSKPSAWKIYVKDNGIGIPKDKQNIIFERFRQAEESISRSYEGAGLGLSIAKAFVELLNGQIWLESEPGKGSVFYFTIPYVK